MRWYIVFVVDKSHGSHLAITLSLMVCLSKLDRISVPGATTKPHGHGNGVSMCEVVRGRGGMVAMKVAAVVRKLQMLKPGGIDMFSFFGELDVVVAYSPFALENEVKYMRRKMPRFLHDAKGFAWCRTSLAVARLLPSFVGARQS